MRRSKEETPKVCFGRTDYTQDKRRDVFSSEATGEIKNIQHVRTEDGWERTLRVHEGDGVGF